MSDRLDMPAPTGFSDGGPLARVGRVVMGVLSSVWLGVTLLVLLFVYSSLGSAGVVYPTSWNIFDSTVWRHDMVRQYTPFELTEFEWFHTWAFVGMCALLTVNLVVTTIRRIPLRVVNLGVWMIHTGVVVLIVGSVIYFATKIEGDAPVFRRAVVVETPGGSSGVLPVLVGRELALEDESGRWVFGVSRVDPSWPLLTGERAGEEVFSASVSVTPPVGEAFVRQLLAGHPDLTEDVLPGRGRAVRLEEFGGRKLVDDRVSMRLALDTQEHFWIKDSRAIASRELGAAGEPAGPWRQRIIAKMPRYNDYAGSMDAVLPPMAGQPASEVTGAAARSIEIPVPPAVGPDAAADPLAGVDVTVTGYLRYAFEQVRLEPGGDELNPVASVAVSAPGGGLVTQQLAAFVPEMREGFEGAVALRYAADAAELDAIADRLSSKLTVTVPSGAEPLGGDGSASVTIDLSSPEARAAVEIGESGWVARVETFAPRFEVGGREHAVAILEMTAPDGEIFTRWVFDEPTLNRDLEGPAVAAGGHGAGPAERPRDDRVRARLRVAERAPLVIVVGPEDAGVGLRLLTRIGGGLSNEPVSVGEPVEFGGGARLVVRDYSLTGERVTKPRIVPHSRRDRNAQDAGAFAMARLRLEKGDWSDERWVKFHKYSLDDPRRVAVGLGRAEPEVFDVPDGEGGVRPVEVIFTRERRELPAPVALEEFVLTPHLGGFTGETSSIRDWTSVLRFYDGSGEPPMVEAPSADGAETWSGPVEVSTNDPAAYAGLRYFQAFWDAPSDASRGGTPNPGMAFTGLGIGNRNGVYTQLAGSTLACIGMIYAFYVKPIIKRREAQRLAVIHGAGARGGERRGRPPADAGRNEPERELIGGATS